MRHMVLSDEARGASEGLRSGRHPGKQYPRGVASVRQRGSST